MANIHHYSFWLWQYEVRSDKPTKEKTFRSHNYADPDAVNISVSGQEFTNKISADTIIAAIIANSFTPFGPSISSETSQRACLSISKNFHPSDMFVGIKYNAPIDRIIPEIKMLIAKRLQQSLSMQENKDIDFLKKKDDEIMSLYRRAEEELNAYFVKDKPNIHKEGAKRALGLWLFDYCQKHSCGCPTAEAALRETSYLRQLQYDKDSRNFARLLKNTRDCIAACDVLPIG